MKINFTEKQKIEIVKSYVDGLVQVIKLAEQYKCSRRTIYQILIKSGIDTSKSTGARRIVKCANCDTEISITRERLRKKTNSFCNEKCYYGWLRTGYGHEFVSNRNSLRNARNIVKQHFDMKPGQVVHHKDRNQFNNDINNLMVFENSGDHLRHHRGFKVKSVWDGSK